MLKLRVFSALFKTVLNRFETARLAALAFVDTFLHFVIMTRYMGHKISFRKCVMAPYAAI